MATISDIFKSFVGLNAMYTKSVNDVNILKSNKELRSEVIADKIKEVKDKLFNTYEDMLDKAIKKADLCILDKMEGYRVCNIPKLTDEQKVYHLNFYTNVVEKLGGVDKILDFMSKDNNINNQVYREIFLLKTETYKTGAAAIGIADFAKVDEMVKTINGDCITGIAEIRQIKDKLQSLCAGGMLYSRNFIYYNLENADFKTMENVQNIFTIQDGTTLYYR